jgi:proteasome lid subunit RPN8/RPN11
MGSSILDPLELKPHGYLSITAQLWEEMRLEVMQHVPEEACGLLAGLKNQVRIILPIANELHSPVRFRMAARDQLKAFEQIDQAGLELLGIYHSHPNGPDRPSATDIAEAFYPEVVYLIWSPQDRDWSCHAFNIRDGQFQAATLSVRNL